MDPYRPLPSRQAASLAASERALGLLLGMISQGERSELERTKMLPCTGGSGYKYRLELKKEMSVWVFDPTGRTRLGTLCAFPWGDVPVYDSVLSQYLSLKFDEERFWGTANYFAKTYELPIPFRLGGKDVHAYDAGQRIELTDGRGQGLGVAGQDLRPGDVVGVGPDGRFVGMDFGLGAGNRPIGVVVLDGNMIVVNNIMAL